MQAAHAAAMRSGAERRFTFSFYEIGLARRRLIWAKGKFGLLAGLVAGWGIGAIGADAGRHCAVDPECG